MLVLGLILLLGSAAAGAGLVIDGNQTATVEVFGVTINNMTTATVFFSGAATMLCFLLGLWLLTTKAGRSRRKRVERKTARRQQKESVASLEADRAKLAAENERLSDQLDIRRETTSAPTKTSAPTNTSTGTPTGSTHT